MLATVFPGQGSQLVGMGKFLYEEFKEARLVFEEASDSLSYSMNELCFEGPLDKLTQTEFTQPALLTTSYATFKVLQSITGLNPSYSAGHSVGEYASVVTSDVISFSQGLIAVRERGKSMQSAVPVGQGSMVAVIGLEDESINSLCNWVKGKLGESGLIEAANFNCPGQVVLSGKKTSVDWLMENIKNYQSEFEPNKKIRLLPLNVSAPFHCSLMSPAADTMRDVLGTFEFRTPLFPIVQNYSAKEEIDPELIRENLINQVAGSVKWTQSILHFKKLGVDSILELGPGKILSGLIKKIDSEGFQVLNTNSLEDLKLIEEKLNH